MGVRGIAMWAAGDTRGMVGVEAVGVDATLGMVMLGAGDRLRGIVSADLLGDVTGDDFCVGALMDSLTVSLVEIFALGGADRRVVGASDDIVGADAGADDVPTADDALGAAGAEVVVGVAALGSNVVTVAEATGLEAAPALVDS